MDRAVLIVLEACAEKKVNQPDVTEIRSWGAHYVAERERITAMVTDLEKKLGEKSRAEA